MHSKYYSLAACLILVIFMVLSISCTNQANESTTRFPIITDVQTSQPRAIPGQPFPIIFWIGSDNSTHNLGEFKGKPILINTWDRDCKNCRDQFPYFQEIVDKYCPDQLVFFSIDTLDAPNTVREYLSSNKYNLTVLLDYQKGLIYKKFGLPSPANPYTFFIDQSGTLAELKIGAFESTGEIETILKQKNMIK
jgi:thiol-disulfide isomerase/thioredoxin